MQGLSTGRFFCRVALIGVAAAVILSMGIAPNAHAATPSAFNRYYNPSTGDHWVTTQVGSVTPGYNLEGTLGYLLTAAPANSRALYSCRAGGDHFISFSSTCTEGGPSYTNLGKEGYIFKAAPAGINSVALYRCYHPGDHFVSIDISCEQPGIINEGRLGYALSNQSDAGGITATPEAPSSVLFGAGAALVLLALRRRSRTKGSSTSAS